MNYILLTFLFVSAAEAFQSQVHLPENTVRNKLAELDHYLRDGPVDVNKLRHPSMTKTTARLAHLLKKGEQMNDREGQEHGEGEGSVAEAVKMLADSLGEIVPALKTLKAAKDKRNREKALELMKAIRSEPSNDKVKTILGRHVADNYDKCEKIKEVFHSKALSVLDFDEEMDEVLEDAGLGEKTDDFKALTHTDPHGVMGKMKQLVVDAACDKKVDGLFKNIGEVIEEQDPDGEFDLSNRIEPYTDPKIVEDCEEHTLEELLKHVKRDSAPSEVGNDRKRIIDLVFENSAEGNCIEVKLYKKYTDLIIKGIILHYNWGIIHGLTKGYEEELIKRVTSLMEQKNEVRARIAVGEYTLDIVRGTLVISHIIKNNGLENVVVNPAKGPEKRPKKRPKNKGPGGKRLN
ncbi:uncharacterized protein LOC111322539 [Stylophora pistillata]|uniref:uncharacterized protein LOC111322539 n=1 Tax=Stylophora pistillata TaxID=50429 RepID=UPI000C039FB3|nr:uncharacterized protein LOC111322539 [Stylophora pistillata]